MHPLTAGKLLARLYDKRDDFDLHIVNFLIPLEQYTIWPLLLCIYFREGGGGGGGGYTLYSGVTTLSKRKWDNSTAVHQIGVK